MTDMTYRLSERRRRVLQDVAARRGRFHPMLVTAEDLTAFEELGPAHTADDCGQVRSAPEPGGAHRSPPHTLRLNGAGFAAATAAGGPFRALTTPTGRRLAPLIEQDTAPSAAPVVETPTRDE
ncbi:hypothetical protein ACWD4N_47750 [Streptomyces sp. NPDC002586]